MVSWRPFAVAVAVAAAAGVTLRLSRKRPHWKSLRALLRIAGVQCEVIPAASANESPTLCAVAPPEATVDSDGHIISLYSDVSTLHDGFIRGLSISGPSSRCVGVRVPPSKEYSWLSYGEIATRRTNFGAGLLHYCAEGGPFSQSGVCLYLPNSVEWVIADLACYAYSFFTVPISVHADAKTVVHIIDETEASCVVCSSSDALDLVLGFAAEGLPNVQVIVKVGQLTDRQRAVASQLGLQLLSFESVEAKGCQYPRPHRPPAASVPPPPLPFV
jgi:hypothetical protein